MNKKNKKNKKQIAGMSSGGTTGIVLGVLIVLALIGAVAYFGIKSPFQSLGLMEKEDPKNDEFWAQPGSNKYPGRTFGGQYPTLRRRKL